MSVEHTTIVGAPDAVGAAADEPRAWHDRYAGALVLAIVLVVVAAVSVLTVRWFGGLDVVTPVGNGVTATNEKPGTVIVGTQIVAYGPWDAPFAYDLEPVDVRSITPVVVENSADADITLLRCTGGEPVGVTDANILSGCPGAAPFVPGTMVLATVPPNDIIAVITSRKPGVVRIEGFRVDYAVGPRSTTVDAGINVLVRIGAAEDADDDSLDDPLDDTSPTP
jgi:hypothetical protein